MEVLLYDSTICRLCAQENSNGIIIFNNPDTEADISKLINKYLPLKVIKLTSFQKLYALKYFKLYLNIN